MIIKRVSILLLLITIFVLMTSIYLSQETSVNSASVKMSRQEQICFDKVNQFRREIGVPELNIDNRLVAVAKYHAHISKKCGGVTHNGLSENCEVVSMVVILRKFDWYTGYIDLHTDGIKDPIEAAWAWYYSEGHKRAMLNPIYDCGGIGKAADIYVLFLGSSN